MTTHRMIGRLFGRAALLLGLLLVSPGCSAGPRLSEEARANFAKRHHILRFEADVVFDGAPLRFDELIECQPLIDDRSRVQNYERRRYVVARLADGGALAAHVHPFYCSFFSHLWRGGEERVMPETFLPIFEHWDVADAPTRREQYVSESYYDKPYARLRIERLTLSPAAYPPTEADIAAAREQARRDRPNFYRDGDDDWTEWRLVPIEEKVWGREPRLAAYFRAFEGQTELVNIGAEIEANRDSDELKHIAKRITNLSRWEAGSTRSLIGGVPRLAEAKPGDRPGVHPDDRPPSHSALSWMDSAIPIDKRNGACFADTSRTGYLIAHYQPPEEAYVLLCEDYSFDGRGRPSLRTLSGWRLFYDPLTRRIFKAFFSKGAYWN